MAKRTYEEQLADLDAQIARAKARRQAVVARNSKEERKARNHALIVAGGLVMQCFEDGWQSVDWQGLSAVIANNKEVFAKHTAGVLPTAEAARRLREWEKCNRETESDDYGQQNGSQSRDRNGHE